MSDDSIYATYPKVSSLNDCKFYHTMDIPGHGLAKGLWDLRGKTDEYIGHYELSGKRVLEIGPASGFLTFEMEKRGAKVVAIDVKEDPGWDFVPYPASVMYPVYAGRRQAMRQLRNSFWFAHHAFNSQAKVWYGDTYNLPDALGHFDVALMASVLLHTKSPLEIMAQCAKRASTLIVIEPCFEELEGRAVCRLQPTAENKTWDAWWHLSSDIIRQFASVLGFTKVTMSKHSHVRPRGDKSVPFFTVIASK